MPAIVKLGNICSGHNGFPPRPNVGASGDIFMENLGTVRVGDPFAVHCKPSFGCHSGVEASGSPNVYANNRPVARVGDAISCGSVCAQGASTVFAN
jgi:uncharacterized Zn-binding protein involved in type VI secretion